MPSAINCNMFCAIVQLQIIRKSVPAGGHFKKKREAGLEMGIVELADFVRKRINELGISKKELARRGRLARSLIYKILNYELTSLTENTLRKLAFTLGVTSAELHSLLWKGVLKVSSKQKSKSLIEENGSIFIRDVTYPDNEMVHINQEFEKVWEIRNIGKVTWEDRFLKRMDSPEGEGALICVQELIPLPKIMPGETVSVAVKFKAPSYPCTTISYWKMVDNEGNLCFPDKKGLWCRVMVTVIGV